MDASLLKIVHFIGSIEVNMVANAHNNSRSAAEQTTDNLAYITQMLSELRVVAEREGAEMLCYLIEMAYIEAGDIQSGRRKLSVGHVKRNPPRGMPV
ncbi:hypothetical protein GGQ73_004337 [Rhizobium skierniewicense]|uniref:Uncharacterized protein n=2 Tax=Rhizobium skierniewicense TaxID=984260 RepID=A0A7W6CBE7_9HYPH|nr:hypothetical protein [Rhizobium skierniewicense]